MWRDYEDADFMYEDFADDAGRGNDFRWLARAAILAALVAPFAYVYRPDAQVALVVGAFFAISIAVGDAVVVPIKRMIRQRAWFWNLATFMRGAAVAFAGLILQSAAVAIVAARVHDTGIAEAFNTRSTAELALIVVFLLGLVTSILGLASMLLPWDANALEKGSFDRPEDDPGTRRAIQEQALRSAQRKVLRLPEQSPVFGVVVKEDRRTWFRRHQAPLLETPERLRFDQHGRSAGGYWLKSQRRVHASVPLARLGEPPVRATFLGSSGFGKTNAIRQLVLHLLGNGETVWIVDGKGDQDSVFDFASLALRANRPLTIDSGRGLDIFGMGERVAIAALISLFPFRGGDGDEYQKRHVAAIRATFCGPAITHIDEFLDRLSNPSRECLEEHAYRQLRAPALGGQRHATQGEETRRALEHYEHVLERLRDPSWTFQTSGLVYAKIPLPEENDYGQLVIAAFSAFRGLEHPRERPRCTMIIDEAASLATANNAVDLAQLMEQLRSQGMGFVLVTQSFHGLGEQAKRLLHAGTAVYLGNSSDPEDILRVIGTRTLIEAGLSRDANRRAKGDSARVQYQYLVTPDRIRSLPIGVLCCSTPVPGDRRIGRVTQIIVVGPITPVTHDEHHSITELLRSTRIAPTRVWSPVDEIPRKGLGGSELLLFRGDVTGPECESPDHNTDEPPPESAS